MLAYNMPYNTRRNLIVRQLYPWHQPAAGSLADAVGIYKGNKIEESLTALLEHADISMKVTRESTEELSRG